MGIKINGEDYMKKIYLLDTNIVSEFSKERPDKNVVALYFDRKELCAISSVTWQELIRGVSRMPEGKRKNIIQGFINQLNDNMEVIPYDKFSAQICGEIQTNAEQNGKSLPYYDSQIAATAISNGMVLVTHNVDDFEPIKEKSFLHVEDWFSEYAYQIKCTPRNILARFFSEYYFYYTISLWQV